MVLLLESPLAVAAIGLLLVALAGVVYSQLRTGKSFVLLIVAVLLAVGMFVAERLWQTPAEQVRGAIAELFVAIKADDLPGVLALIDSTAIEMRSDAETLIPMFQVESAGEGGEVRIELQGDDAATANFKPLIKVQHRQSGAMGAYFDHLQIDFVRHGDRWLASGYQAAKDWRSEADRLGR